MPSESAGLDQSWDVLVDGIEAEIVNLGPVTNEAMRCHPCSGMYKVYRAQRLARIKGGVGREGLWALSSL